MNDKAHKAVRLNAFAFSVLIHIYSPFTYELCISKKKKRK